MRNIIPIEYKNQRILTTEQLAEAYETSTDNIKNNFKRNKENFEQGKHYFFLEGLELKAFKNWVTDSYPVDKHTRNLYLWTERGASRHCKILDTDKAWEQFDNLEETYFKVKEKQLPKTDDELIFIGYSRAIEKIKLLEQKIENDKPKTLFADAVSASQTSILVGEMAKLLKQNGVDTGQNRFFEWLRKNKYLISRKGTDYNMPTQHSMELGLFEIKETSIVHPDGHTSINKTPKVTGKGQQYFINLFLNKGTDVRNISFRPERMKKP